MLEREKMAEEITCLFATFSTYISMRSQQLMFNSHRVTETVLVTLLNMLYGWELKDLNLEKKNHPAVDLGDKGNGLAVQVTADGSKQKMKDTLVKLEKHQLNETYRKIIFLIISNDEKKQWYKDGYVIKVCNLSDIAADICSLESTEDLRRLYKFCKGEFTDYLQKNMENSEKSIFEPVKIQSQDVITASEFLAANYYEKDVNGFYFDDYSESDFIADLNSLKDKLASLTNDDRWFIYKALTWSFNAFKNETHFGYCWMPCSHFYHPYPPENKIYIRSIVEKLEKLDLLVYWRHEEHWSEESEHVVVKFYGNVNDFDYFSPICQYFRYNKIEYLLEDTIINCNFSHIK